MGQGEEQIEFFRRESLSFFRRNYDRANLRAREVSPYLAPILDAHPISIEGGAILDVGCGAANNLHHLMRKLRTARGVGTEPNADVVNELRGTFPELGFEVSDTRALPFATGEFDLVVVRQVLCWIDRNYLLQMLGEVLRVSKRYVIISDYAPTRRLSAVYHHAPDFRTYKMCYVPVLEASGVVRCVASLSFDPQDDWLAIQTSLFERIPLDRAFPLVEPPPGQGR